MKVMASGLITSWPVEGEQVKTVPDFIFLGSKVTAESRNHETERCLLLGRKAMTNLDSVLKSRDITLLTKVCIVKAMFFFFSSSHVQMWELGHKKVEHRGIDAFELWCWRRLLRMPWTARRSNQSIQWPDAMIFDFWMFKPAFSLSSFTFIKRLFSSSSLSAIKVVFSAYVQLPSRVRLFVTPWTAALQSSLSFTVSQFAQTHVHWVGDVI